MDKDRNHLVREIGFSLLAEGKIIRIRADGYSMFPSIRPGSVVLIEPFSGDNIPAHGDVIAWKRDSGFVVHRLIRTVKENNKLYFITRGDSCAYEDKPIPEELVAGKVVSTETSAGIRRISMTRRVTKHGYLYNRIRVWIILRLRKVLKITKMIE